MFHVLVYFLCKSPLFENLVRGSPPPPNRKKGGDAHYIKSPFSPQNYYILKLQFTANLKGKIITISLLSFLKKKITR